MSDSKKKLFSIEPEADEEPIALVPEPVEDDLTVTVSETVEKNSESPPLLRTVVDIPAPVQKPIFELVDVIEDSGEPAEEPLQTSDNFPQIKLMNLVEPDANTPASEAGDETVVRKADFVPLPVASAAGPSMDARIPPAPAPVHSRSFVNSPMPYRPTVEPYSAPKAPAARRLGWVGPVLTVTTGLAIALLCYAYIVEVGTVSAVGLAALILAVTVPMIAVFALWATIRGLADNRAESFRLAEVADRLTRADETVANDVAQLSSSIRRELSQVDQRLAQSRAELDTLGAQLSRQSSDLGSMTDRMAERSDTIARTVTRHHADFQQLSQAFETRMSGLAQSMDAHRAALESTGGKTADDVTRATQAVAEAAELAQTHGRTLADAAQSADASLRDSEARLAALSVKIATQAEELDAFYERRADTLEALAKRLATDKPLAEKALHSQTEQLSAVDAQIELTESRLSELLDHVRNVQAQLTSRLSDIDTTLTEADKRSRAFTSDIADRVSDSVAQTRREMSIMESELRSLQSRMETASQTPSVTTPRETMVERKVEPPRIHLKPLDTDFPPLDTSDIDLLDNLIDPEELHIPEPDNDVLDLIQPLSDVTPADMPITRPGKVTPSMDGRKYKNWRWRDMLGGIDPITDSTPDIDAPQKPLRIAPIIERPGPGVPLTAPSAVAPTHGLKPDGSEIVARLCEIGLAPSTLFSPTTIRVAATARHQLGDTAQIAVIDQRAEEKVARLRYCFANDLEFRLASESFRRQYDRYIGTGRDLDELRAELSSAPGLAYLLCSAALATP